MGTDGVSSGRERWRFQGSGVKTVVAVLVTVVYCAVCIPLDSRQVARHPFAVADEGNRLGGPFDRQAYNGGGLGVHS